ncbi:MAG TPA: carboxypeptidase-like regulatory domain-containing protein [Terriglobales bacterium]
MYRKLALLMIVMGAALSSWAVGDPGVISGYVRNAAGVPQMGAMVEIAGAVPLTVFTDAHGFYRAAGLRAGSYSVKISAVSFLPALRERVQLSPGASLILDVTLRTLFEAVELAPPRDSSAAPDDWKWVLRSGANRPLLRMVDDPGSVTSAESRPDSHVSGSLAFVAGYTPDAVGANSSGVGTAFSVERPVFGSDTIGLRGNVGYGTSSPASVLRASFGQSDETPFAPKASLTVQSLPAPYTMPGASIEAVSMAVSDGMKFGDLVELKFGSELQGIQFLGRSVAFRPYGTADAHVSKNLTLEYQYATSLPEAAWDDTLGPAEFGELNPRVSLLNYSSAVESAHHHEGSLTYRDDNNTLQAAVFHDGIANPALMGVGEFSADGGDALPDVMTGSFTYRGNNYSSKGVRFVAEHRFCTALAATLDYSFANTLELANTGIALQDIRQSIKSVAHPSVTGKLSGVIPKSKTHVTASYRWTTGAVLTPVDLFNTSVGRAEPFFSIYIRQPIPGFGGLPGRMEAVLDLRNLLAQGYVPVLGDDGQTVYLVQSARAVRGGFSFTF